jgi:CRISPR-associated protein Cas2
MAKTNCFLITYDIGEPKRLRRVHKFLAAKAHALHYSVFAADWTEADLHKVKQALNTIIDPNKDDVRIYAISLNSKVRKTGSYLYQKQGVFLFGSPVLDVLNQAK